MKVYKFGGASVRNADGVRNLRKIIDDEQNLFIIVSAMGKTTNALEKVFEGLQKGDKQLSMDPPISKGRRGNQFSVHNRWACRSHRMPR